MALFGKKKTEEKKDVAPVETKAVATVMAPQAPIILRPRITEKAAILTDAHVYSFEVQKGATKHEIREAVKAIYNVTPVKIRIVNKAPRRYHSAMRGRELLENGLRKAYVYLKKDDRIELV